MNIASSNPYAAPRAQVQDVYGAADTQPIRLWPPSGRIGRLRYLAYSIGATLILMLVMGVIGGLSAAAGMPSLMIVGMVLGYAASIVFTVLITIQRCHDMNWTGWLTFLIIVPLVNLLFFFVPGTKGANRFGAPPPPNTRGVKILASLVVVFFFLGIFAAIAIPAYQQYTMRAKMQQMK